MPAGRSPGAIDPSCRALVMRPISAWSSPPISGGGALSSSMLSTSSTAAPASVKTSLTGVTTWETSQPSAPMKAWKSSGEAAAFSSGSNAAAISLAISRRVSRLAMAVLRRGRDSGEQEAVRLQEGLLPARRGVAVADQRARGRVGHRNGLQEAPCLGDPRSPVVAAPVEMVDELVEAGEAMPLVDGIGMAGLISSVCRKLGSHEGAAHRYRRLLLGGRPAADVSDVP